MYTYILLSLPILSMQFQEISRDIMNGRLRDKSAIYKDVPASHNKIR